MAWFSFFFFFSSRRRHTRWPRDWSSDVCSSDLAKRSGLALDAIDYYVVLARFKMACVLEGGYARYVQGGADNPKMAEFGQVVLDMARRAAELSRTSKL